MSLGGSQKPVVTTETKAPWAGSIPHLTNVMGEAQNLYTGDVGYHPYGGAVTAPIGEHLQRGLSAADTLAESQLMGSPGLMAARDLAGQIQANQGLSPGQTGYAVPHMQNVNNLFHGLYLAGDSGTREGMLGIGGLFGDTYNRAGQSPASDYFTGILANTETSPGQGRMIQAFEGFDQSRQGALGNENPYLQAQIAANDARIADRINSVMAGRGRYGSEVHTDVLGRSLAEAANPILAQDYESRQNRALQATQGMQGAAQGLASEWLNRLGVQTGAAQGLASDYAQRLGLQNAAAQGYLGAYGQSAQEYGNQIARQLSAAQGQQGVLRDISDLYSGGLGRAMQGSTLIPSLDAAQYQGSDRLLGIGNFYQGREQANIDNLIAQYNAAEARPWEQLARYSGIASGMGALGGTTVGTRPSNAPPTSTQVLGGALAGAGIGSSLFPGIGTGLGALGGGLAGLF